MAREVAKGISKPKSVAEEGDLGPKTVDPAEEGKELANLEGYTGPDGSKSLGYLKHPPAPDSSGLGTAADDAGRTYQAVGDNSGAGPSIQAQEATAKERRKLREELRAKK